MQSQGIPLKYTDRIYNFEADPKRTLRAAWARLATCAKVSVLSNPMPGCSRARAVVTGRLRPSGPPSGNRGMAQWIGSRTGCGAGRGGSLPGAAVRWGVPRAGGAPAGAAECASQAVRGACLLMQSALPVITAPGGRSFTGMSRADYAGIDRASCAAVSGCASQRARSHPGVHVPHRALQPVIAGRCCSSLSHVAVLTGGLSSLAGLQPAHPPHRRHSAVLHPLAVRPAYPRSPPAAAPCPQP